MTHHQIISLGNAARVLGLFSLSLMLAACGGSDGAPGNPGENGSPGAPGLDGHDGVNGSDGAVGQDGAPGSAGGAGPAGNDGSSFDLSFSVAMQGDQEAPAPVGTASTGTLRLAVDSQTGAVSGSVRVSFDATKVHIHGPAFAGDTGPVIFELEQVGSDPRSWSIPAGTKLSADQVTALMAGALYVNAHSAEHAAGEVRGQILPPNVSLLRSTLDTAHEIPSPKSGADDLASTGIGYLTLDRDSGVVHGNLRTSFVANKAHIHGPKAPGDTGGIAGRTAAVFQEMTLTQDSTKEDDFWKLPDDLPPLDEAQMARLLSGDFYFNAHTVANATGLVRGQIHGPGVSIFRVPLSAEQEVPAPTGGAVSALGYLTVDRDSGRVRGDVVATGFTPTKAHVHSARIGQTGPVLLELVANAGDASRFSAPEAGLNGSLNAVFDAPARDSLARGQLYLNMHSAANPTGELRGQIVPDNLELVRVPMDGAHEVPAPVGAAGSSALALFVVDPATGGIAGFGRVSGFSATAFHIHRGLVGATGPVVIELAADASETGKFNLPDGVFLDPAALGASGFYVNSHSATNKTGEVRGQLALP